MIKNKKYFSLIELLIAVAIIVILLGMAGGTYRLVMYKINESRTKALVKKLEMAMRSYKHETGYYFQQNSYAPLHINPTDTEFINLIDYTKMRNRGEIDSNGDVVDPWDNYIVYCSDDSNIRNTTLFDLGSPGRDGGWGQNADLIPTSSNFGNGGDDITNTNM